MAAFRKDMKKTKLKLKKKNHPKTKTTNPTKTSKHKVELQWPYELTLPFQTGALLPLAITASGQIDGVWAGVGLAGSAGLWVTMTSNILQANVPIPVFVMVEQAFSPIPGISKVLVSAAPSGGHEHVLSSLSIEKSVYRGGLCACMYFPSELVLPALRAICNEAGGTSGPFPPMCPAQGLHSTVALNAAPNPTGVLCRVSLSSWLPWKHLL